MTKNVEFKIDEVVVRDDIVRGTCFYLQEQLENSVKQKTFKFEHYDQLHESIGDLSAGGVINYKERNEIWAQLKTMFCGVLRKMGHKQNNVA